MRNDPFVQKIYIMLHKLNFNYYLSWNFWTYTNRFVLPLKEKYTFKIGLTISLSAHKEKVNLMDARTLLMHCTIKKKNLACYLVYKPLTIHLSEIMLVEQLLILLSNKDTKVFALIQLLSFNLLKIPPKK